MTFSKLLTASLLGVMSLSCGTLARRDLTDHTPDIEEMCKHASKPEMCKTAFGSHFADSHKPPPPPPDHKPTPAPPDNKPSPPDHKDSPPPERKVNTSSASCTAVATGYSEVDNKKASATASADAKAYVCGKGSKSNHDVASATATAFAKAVAAASVDCKLSGDAKGSASAYAKAEAKAKVWLEAYAEAFASAGDCEHCSAYAESWGYIKKDVFLHAVAEAKAQVEAYTKPGQQVHVKVQDFEKDVQKAVATAYAEALAAASTHYDSNKCVAWVEIGGCVDGDCFECAAGAVSESEIYKIDAIAEASASAAAIACGEHVVTYADVEVSAKALAKATAIAASFVFATCKSDNGGYACADAGTYISDSAKAIAEAFADAWAGALVCDDCYVDADAAVEAIGSVLVTASTSAYEYVCVDGGEAWTVALFQAQIVSGHIEAIAEAIAFGFASSPGGVCVAAVSSGAYVGP